MEKCYRKNAGIVVFNSEGKVFVGARKDKTDLQWQFPQGGIEAGETPQIAAARELCEETGIRDVKLITTLEEPICYDFPDHILKSFAGRGHPYCGQEQYWSLFYFEGNEDEINFETHPEEVEFQQYRWIDIDEAPQLIIYWKKETYLQVAAAFKPFIEKYLREL